MFKIIFINIFLALIFFMSGCHAFAHKVEIPDVPAGSVLAEVPLYRFNQYRICFPVRIDAKEHMFLVDTGASFSLVASSLKPMLGRHILTKKPDVAYDYSPVGYYKMQKPFEIGSVKVTDGIVGCRDIKFWPSLDGILGRPFLEHFIVQLDFKNNKFRLLKLPASPDLVSNFGEALLLQFKSGTAYVTLNLPGGIKEKCILDSGNTWVTILRKEVFDQLATQQNLRVNVSEQGFSNFVIPELNVSLKEHNSSVKVANLECVGLENPPEGYSNVGMQFLLRCDMVTIDWSNKAIYVKLKN